MSLFVDKRSNGQRRVPYRSLLQELQQQEIIKAKELIICASRDLAQAIPATNAYWVHDVLPLADSIRDKMITWIGDSPDTKVLKSFVAGKTIKESWAYNYSLLGERLGIPLTGESSPLLTPEDNFCAECPLRYPLGQIMYRGFAWLDPQLNNQQARWLVISLAAVLAYLETETKLKIPSRFWGKNDLETIVILFWSMMKDNAVRQTFDQAYHTTFHAYLREFAERFELPFMTLKRWLENHRLLLAFLLGQAGGEAPIVLFETIPEEPLYPALTEGFLGWIRSFSEEYRLEDSGSYSEVGVPYTQSHLLLSEPLFIRGLSFLETTLYFN
ncbi:MAG: hypothetical protein ACYCQJ_16100 [Nitrososphaerales archaeon]